MSNTDPSQAVDSGAKSEEAEPKQVSGDAQLGVPSNGLPARGVAVSNTDPPTAEKKEANVRDVTGCKP